MPTYDYECLNCGKSFEAFQKMSDAPLKKCSKCDGVLRRLIGSGLGVIFKGSGFYETDYKKKSPSGNSKKENHGKCVGCPQASCEGKEGEK